VNMKPFLIFAAMAPLLVAAEARGGQDMAVDATYRIVIAEDLTKAEQHAAAQLQEYLKKITGRTLRIVPETDQNSGPAIYVGQTRFAAAHGMKEYGKEKSTTSRPSEKTWSSPAAGPAESFSEATNSWSDSRACAT
jgi:hypothetical protein